MQYSQNVLKEVSPGKVARIIKNTPELFCSKVVKTSAIFRVKMGLVNPNMVFNESITGVWNSAYLYWKHPTTGIHWRIKLKEDPKSSEPTQVEYRLCELDINWDLIELELRLRYNQVKELQGETGLPIWMFTMEYRFRRRWLVLRRDYTSHLLKLNELLIRSIGGEVSNREAIKYSNQIVISYKD